MNKLQLRYFYKLLAFMLAFFLACGFQTSFWPNIISFLPSPQIWLIIIFFISLKWKSVNTIFFIYFLSYCVTLFSEVPLKMLWTTLLVTHVLIVSVKNRIQLTGVFSFILFCFSGSLLFELGYYLFSDLLEPIPTKAMLLERILQILMNFIFSYPIYFALDYLDNAIVTRDDWQQSANPNRNETLV